MHHEQEMPRMGGLKKYLPITYKTMLMGWLAICGIIPFRGLLFEGRDPVEDVFDTHVFGGGKILWFVGFVTAGMTAFYMTRLMVLTFWGEERFRKIHAGGEADEAHAAAHDKELSRARRDCRIPSGTARITSRASTSARTTRLTRTARTPTSSRTNRRAA